MRLEASEIGLKVDATQDLVTILIALKDNTPSEVWAEQWASL